MNSSVYSQCPTTSATCGTDHIGGSVWRDYNFNGVRDNLLLGTNTAGVAQNVIEYGVADIEIVAYDADNNIVDCARTNASGEYVLNVPAGIMVRLDFINIPSWLQASRDSLSGLSTVQFVTSPNCTTNLALNNPSDCFPDKDTLQLATPCYVNGASRNPDGTLVSGSSASADAFAVWSHRYTGIKPNGNLGITDTAEAPNMLARADSVGALWGVACNRTSGDIFSSAVLRRYMSFGSLGTGGIYTINPATNQSTAWMTIPNTGDNPRDLTIYPSQPTEPGGSGAVLPPNLTEDSHDAIAYEQIGTIGIGDIDISTDDKTLYVMNLNTKTIVMVDIASMTILPTSIPVPNPCANGTYRPWALEVHDGYVYMGIVCDTDLEAYVYKVPEGGGTPVPVTINDGQGDTNGFSLNYTRDQPDSGVATIGDWQVWNNTHPSAGGASMVSIIPQPILSDIEFDVDGSMVLGFLDRHGMQMGYQNYSTNQNDFLFPGFRKSYSAVSAGDILRVCNSSGTYNLEGFGACGQNSSYSSTDPQGPFGNEYYDNDSYSNATSDENDLHPEISFGGLELVPGCGEVIMTGYDVSDVEGFAFSGGVLMLDNINSDRNQYYELYGESQSGGEGAAGKAAGLGDIEALGHAVPLEIGNYVWIDSDQDGVQDPGETPVEGMEVTIYNATTGVLEATTLTDANGEYYFDMSDGLEYNTDYFIAIGVNAGTSGVGNFNPATSNININGADLSLTINDTGVGASADMNDSDGTLNPTANGALPAGVPYIAITTGSTGSVNHTYDFGLSCPRPIIVQDVIFGCEGTDIEFCFMAMGSSDIAVTNYGVFTSPAVDTADIYDTPTGDYTSHTVTSATDTICQTITLPALSGTVPDTSYIYGFFPTSAGTICEGYDSVMVINYPIINMKACLIDTIMLAVDTSLNNVNWFDTNGLLVGSGNPLALDTSMITGTATLAYTATDTNDCDVSECCAVTVTFEDCCKPDICLPFTVTIKRGGRN